MILYISYRTDIPAFYGEWLYNRFQQGYLWQRNPMNPHMVNSIKLDDTIDAIVFCSKNYKPFMKWLPYFNRKFNCYFNYTINAYEHDIETYVPAWHRSLDYVDDMLQCGVKPKQIAWRYDPILFTDKYNIKWHKDRLNEMIQCLYDKTDRCIFSFVSTIYPNVKKNIPNLIEPTIEMKDEILSYMEHLSETYDLTFQTCGHGTDFIDKHPLIKQSGCTSIDILENACDIKFDKIALGGKRPGCLCIDGRNIGDYGTCKHGCKYCYADRASFIKHEYDKDYPILMGVYDDENDKLIESNQKSYLIKSTPVYKELDLFGWNR